MPDEVTDGQEYEISPVIDPGIVRASRPRSTGGPPAAQALAREVHATIRKAVPHLRLGTTAGAPSYMGNGVVVVVGTMKDWVSIGFWRGAELERRHPILVGTGKRFRHVRVESLADARSPALKSLLRAAAQLDAASRTARPRAAIRSTGGRPRNARTNGGRGRAPASGGVSVSAELRARWTSVDDYLESSLLPEDSVLEATLQTSEGAGLPAWAVSPLQGRFLQMLAQSISSRRILEIGTLGGYSAIWLGRAVPSEGRVISIEIDPVHARVARRNLERAGLADQVEIRVGRAQDLLRTLDREGGAAFDMVFIDADKPSSAAYFSWAVDHTRPGGLVVVDNVVREGRVIDPADPDPNVRGTRKLLEKVREDSRVTAVVLPTVGRKGYDGFLIARVEPEPKGPATPGS